jgi:hypothetical protein
VENLRSSAPKAKPGASEAKPVKLLSGGNPQIAKADCDSPVQAYIAGMPGWKRDLGKRLDALIVRNVPNVRKAVKWNSPLYGIERQGWFLGFHTFTHCVKVAFFRGTSLRPVPPGASKGKDTRYIDIHKDDMAATARTRSRPTTKRSPPAHSRTAAAATPGAISKFRSHYGLTRKLLARMTGLSERTLASWETGKPVGPSASTPSPPSSGSLRNCPR